MPEVFPTVTTWELLLRIVVAGALGGLVGFERELGDQPAGFRTHILVALGAALFTIVGAFGLQPFTGGGNARVTFDPTRVAAQVVTGVGFLGAGAILRQGVSVRGLTTAASLWVTAAIGTAVGLGYWTAGVATALATVAALWGLKRIERMIFPRVKRGRYRVVIEMGPNLRLSDLAMVVEEHSADTESMKLVTGDEGGRRLVVRMALPAGVSAEDIAGALERVHGVLSVDVS